MTVDLASRVVELDNLAGNKEHKPLGAFPSTAGAASRVEQFVRLKLFHLICAWVEPAVPGYDYDFAREIHSLRQSRSCEKHVDAVAPFKKRFVQIPLFSFNNSE